MVLLGLGDDLVPGHEGGVQVASCVSCRHAASWWWWPRVAQAADDAVGTPGGVTLREGGISGRAHGGGSGRAATVQTVQTVQRRERVRRAPLLLIITIAEF